MSCDKMQMSTTVQSAVLLHGGGLGVVLRTVVFGLLLVVGVVNGILVSQVKP